MPRRTRPTVELRWVDEIRKPTRRSHSEILLSSELLVGALPAPVADLRRSGGGKWYHLSVDLPGCQVMESGPLEKMRTRAEDLVRSWFARALGTTPDPQD